MGVNLKKLSSEHHGQAGNNKMGMSTPSSLGWNNLCWLLLAIALLLEVSTMMDVVDGYKHQQGGGPGTSSAGSVSSHGSARPQRHLKHRLKHRNKHNHQQQHTSSAVTQLQDGATGNHHFRQPDEFLAAADGLASAPSADTSTKVLFASQNKELLDGHGEFKL
jgi:hypothetical protein